MRMVGAAMLRRLQAMKETHRTIGEVRGRGLLLALELKGKDAAKVARTAMDRGLLINAPRPDTLRFMPALNVTREEIDQMLFLLSAVFRES